MRTTTEETIEAEDVAPEAPSFEAFYLEHYRAVFSAMWVVTRSTAEAEEIAQDAFLKVLERWQRVASLDDPTGYLFRTAANLWRSKRRRAVVAARKVIHRTLGPDDLELAESRADVVRLLDTLSPRQRAAIVLVDLVGLSSEDAGAALGVRASTVRVQAARARAALKEGMRTP